MDAYYVRVYTMKDGSTQVPHAIYETYDQASIPNGRRRKPFLLGDMEKFNPSGAGVNDLENVSYVQVV